MQKKSLKSAFTLVELLVAMAIIAALMGMSVYGINLVQRSSRNTERRAALNNFDIAVRNHQINYGTYPSLATAPGANTLEIRSDGVYISSSAASTEKVVEFKGSTTPGTSTSSGSTQYCYSSSGSTFAIGVKLEGGKFEEKKSDNTVSSCTIQ